MKAVDGIDVVDVRLVSGDGFVKAFADVKFDLLAGGSIVVKGFVVMTTKRGATIVTMPRKTMKDGKWYDVVSPLDEETKAAIEAEVLSAFKEEASK